MTQLACSPAQSAAHSPRFSPQSSLQVSRSVSIFCLPQPRSQAARTLSHAPSHRARAASHEPPAADCDGLAGLVDAAAGFFAGLAGRDDASTIGGGAVASHPVGAASSATSSTLAVLSQVRRHLAWSCARDFICP